MYGIDQTQSFDFMKKKELEQVCIGQYQVILHFTDDLSISADCLMRLSGPDGTSVDIYGDNCSLSRNTTCLLGSSIVSVNSVDKEELSILFSNDYTLSIIDSNKKYESFSIVINDDWIIV